MNTSLCLIMKGSNILGGSGKLSKAHCWRDVVGCRRVVEATIL